MGGRRGFILSPVGSLLLETEEFENIVVSFGDSFCGKVCYCALALRALRRIMDRIRVSSPSGGLCSGGVFWLIWLLWELWNSQVEGLG